MANRSEIGEDWRQTERRAGSTKSGQRRPGLVSAEAGELTGSTDTVQVSLSHLREIEIDNNVHGLDVDTTREQIGTDQVTTEAVSEVVEHAVTMVLGHFCMNVVARVAQLGDLLRQQFDTLSGVAEND